MCLRFGVWLLPGKHYGILQYRVTWAPQAISLVRCQYPLIWLLEACTWGLHRAGPKGCTDGHMMPGTSLGYVSVNPRLTPSKEM